MAYNEEKSIFDVCKINPDIRNLAQGEVCLFPEQNTLPPKNIPWFLDDNHKEAFMSWKMNSNNIGILNYIARLKDPAIIGRNYSILDKDGFCIKESYWERDGIMSQSAKWLDPEKEGDDVLNMPAIRVNKTVIMLGGPWCGNYYHWMIDSLPKLRLVEEYLGHMLRDPNVFFIAPIDIPFVKETLIYSGIPENRMINYLDHAFSFADLYFISPANPYLTTTVETKDWLRKRFLPDLNQGDPTSFIYLSRNDSSKRNIINEKEFESMLDKYGFNTLRTDGMSVLDQANIFSSAKVIIAPHGAGLTNLIFCQPHTLVIELMASSYVSFVYYSLSSACNHRYIFIMNKATTESDDLEAPLMFLDQLLDKLLPTI